MLNFLFLFLTLKVKADKKMTLRTSLMLVSFRKNKVHQIRSFFFQLLNREHVKSWSNNILETLRAMLFLLPRIHKNQRK